VEPIDPAQPESSDAPAREDDDARLDALLAQARWPESSDASQRRLLATWSVVSPAQPRWRWRFTAAAAAAAILLASGVVLVQIQRSTHVVTAPSVSVSPAPVLPAPEVAIRPNSSKEAPRPPALYVAGSREPTPRERLLTSDSPRRDRNGAIDDNASLLRHATPESIQAYLARVADRQTRWAALSALDGLPNPPVDALLEQLSNPRVALRYAAARALGRIDGPATTAALVGQIERGDRRRESVAALLCSRGENASAVVADIRSSSHLAAVVRSAEVQLNSY
jgi:hypothetical protein